jgi:WD40 repeat protein
VVTVQRRAHVESVNTLSFSADGTLLASAGYDGYIRVWDTMTGELSRSILNVPFLDGDEDMFPSAISTVQFCPADNQFDNRLLLSTIQGGTELRIWNVSSGELVRQDYGSMFAVYSPDGETIATIRHNCVEIYWADVGDLRCRFDSYSHDVQHIFFSLDGSQLTVVNCYDKDFHVFTTSTGHSAAITVLQDVSSPYRIHAVIGRDWVRDMQRREAFAMGNHPRLGAATLMPVLDAGVVAMILHTV